MRIVINNTCTQCGLTKLQTDFVKATNTKSGYRGHCKTCNNAYYAQRRITHYEKVRSYEKKFHRARRLKYEYNITEEQLQDIRDSQDNRCAICAILTTLVIDHCHAKGHVRGLLCSKCNIGLGHFKDSPELLENAIKYLKDNK